MAIIGLIVLLMFTAGGNVDKAPPAASVVVHETDTLSVPDNEASQVMSLMSLSVEDDPQEGEDKEDIANPRLYSTPWTPSPEESASTGCSVVTGSERYSTIVYVDPCPYSSTD